MAIREKDLKVGHRYHWKCGSFNQIIEVTMLNTIPNLMFDYRVVQGNCSRSKEDEGYNFKANGSVLDRITPYFMKELDEEAEDLFK